MIVFSAFTPHTPLLVESIGREARQKLGASVAAMDRLKIELERARPDAIVVISAHAAQHPDAFSANLHDPYGVDLRAFGDVSTERAFLPSLPLVDAIQRGVRRAGFRFTLDSRSTLDYGASVPLLLLTRPENAPRIVPVAYAGLDAKSHYAFGRALRDVLLARQERIAIVASGDLSHALTSDAPAGFAPEGAAFDEAARRAASSASASGLLALDPKTVTAAAECAYLPLLVLLGTIDQARVRPEELAYEAPFGVGYLTARFAHSEV